MKNLAFCTVAHGDNCISRSLELVENIKNLGYHLFVLTDDPKKYKEYENVTAIKYEIPYFSFHSKRLIAMECLNYYETAFFLDCDVVIKDAEDLNIFEDMKPGLHIFANFGDLSNSFLNEDVFACKGCQNRNTKYGKEGRDFLEKMGYKYKMKYGDQMGYLEHFLEGRWMIKKDNGNEALFFKIWDLIADFCEKKDIELGYYSNIGAGEGAAMSIAAHNSGIKVNHYTNLSFVLKHFISNYRRKMEGSVPWEMPG